MSSTRSSYRSPYKSPAGRKSPSKSSRSPSPRKSNSPGKPILRRSVIRLYEVGSTARGNREPIVHTSSSNAAKEYMYKHDTSIAYVDIGGKTIVYQVKKYVPGTNLIILSPGRHRSPQASSSSHHTFSRIGKGDPRSPVRTHQVKRQTPKPRKKKRQTHHRI